MKITLGIAYGLLYLHEDSSLRVMHWDFKSNNTMLEDDFTTKVLILGLVRITLDKMNFWLLSCRTYMRGHLWHAIPPFVPWAPLLHGHAWPPLVYHPEVHVPSSS